MKIKLLLLSLFLSIFTLQSFAQKDGVGIKGGLNVSTIGGDAQGAVSKLGFHFGMYGSFAVTDKISVQPEVVFSQQGASLNRYATANYNYVNVPVMAKFYIGESFNLQLGPQLGLLVLAKVKGNNINENVTNQLNAIDFALGMGTSYDIQDKVSFGLRYNLGVTSTISDERQGYFPNGVIQLSIGCRLNK